MYSVAFGSEGPTWRGNNVKRADVEQHIAFVRPFTKSNPNATPSVYFVADVILRMHEILNGKLLKPHGGTTVKHIACREAAKIKKLCAEARFLYRGSKKSYSDTIQQLKNMMAPKRHDDNVGWEEEEWTIFEKLWGDYGLPEDTFLELKAKD